jgi:hypothetical protein
VAEGVSVRQVDLASELQILAFHDQHMTVARPVDLPEAANGREESSAARSRSNGRARPAPSSVLGVLR